MRRHRDTIEGVAVRHLDQLQEAEPGSRGSRTSALVMASFGGACIVFAALALMRSPSTEPPKTHDPLSELVERSDASAKGSKKRLGSGDVTFPQVLSDKDDTTTAMELVRGQREAERARRKAARDAPAGSVPAALPLDQVLPFDGPPPASDKLPVVPLPAQDMLPRPRPSIAPGDTLRSMASHVAREKESGDVAEAGRPGSYQLQVASFKKPEDAEGFALALRRRGHRAHVEQAHVKGRGLWHRVRVGPFKYKRSAQIYRQDFEAKERLVTFVVNPPKTRIRIGLADTAD